MVKYKNLILIGTSHISKESILLVKNTIEQTKPAIIAIELDKNRAKALFSKNKKSINLKQIREMGIKGFIINLLGAWLEKYLGKKVNIKPGSEMKIAILLAKENHLKLALIDQDIRITLHKLIKRITFKEKLTLIKEVILGLFSKKQKINLDLSKVPSDKLINDLITKVKKTYPSVYLTLIEERNKIMTKNLYKLMTIYPNKLIVAIIGAGHKKEIIGELKSKFKSDY